MSILPQYQIDPILAEQCWSMICKATNIGIISHRHPDPDSLGSNFTLKETLTQIGKNVTSLSIDPLPVSCQCFFPEPDDFCYELDSENFDLLITVDCGSLSQVGFELPKNHSRLINIDHHVSNNSYGDLNLVYPTASSTSELIYLLLKIWNRPVSSRMATALLMGIYFDTGSFMHTNVTGQLLDIASALTTMGADLALIKRKIIQNFTENKFHLWGQVMENITINDQRTAIAVITPENFRDSETHSEDSSGIINYVCMAKNSQFALMINQEDPGQLRGSLRTNNDNVDLFEIAKGLGGGGHKKASGFSFPGTMQKQLIWKITN